MEEEKTGLKRQTAYTACQGPENINPSGMQVPKLQKFFFCPRFCCKRSVPRWSLNLLDFILLGLILAHSCRMFKGHQNEVLHAGGSSPSWAEDFDPEVTNEMHKQNPVVHHKGTKGKLLCAELFVGVEFGVRGLCVFVWVLVFSFVLVNFSERFCCGSQSWSLWCKENRLWGWWLTLTFPL